MEETTGTVVAVSISDRKGMRKTPVGFGTLREQWGLEGDAHAGPGARQVSLLAVESIERMRDLGLDVGPGDFAENITTRGLVIHELAVGDTVHIGEAVLRVTQIGKECHDRCAIYEQAGDCVMPREGVFAEVISGGRVAAGDVIRIEPRPEA